MTQGDTVTVTLTNIEVITEDGLILRGFHIRPSNNTGPRKRFIQYMHGTRVYLPNKVRFFVELSSEMAADIIAFAYRGFSLSDGDVPNETGIRLDTEAISHYFEQVVQREGGAEQVDALLWGKSFGTCTTTVAALSRPHLYEKVILESPLTTV